MNGISLRFTLFALRFSPQGMKEQPMALKKEQNNTSKKQGTLSVSPFFIDPFSSFPASAQLTQPGRERQASIDYFVPSLPSGPFSSVV
jgi:hypothetical protein